MTKKIETINYIQAFFDTICNYIFCRNWGFPMNNKDLRKRIDKIREAQTIITQEINALYNEISELIEVSQWLVIVRVRNMVFWF